MFKKRKKNILSYVLIFFEVKICTPVHSSLVRTADTMKFRLVHKDHYDYKTVSVTKKEDIKFEG